MVSANRLESQQETRVKPGLLPWLKVQLSLSFTTSPSCLFLPPRKPDHITRVLFWGQKAMSAFPRAQRGWGGASAGSADLAQKREHLLLILTPHIQLSLWEGKVRRILRWASPPPNLFLSPAQAPEELTILGETPVVPIPIPAPSQGSERYGDRAREAEPKAEGLRPKNKDKDRDRETEAQGRHKETYR